MAMDITRIAYEKYKLKWMMDHGYTLTDLVNELSLMRDEYPEQEVFDWFAAWEFNFGFSSEIWACYNEFMESEFLDNDYMMSILTPYERLEYLRYRNKEVRYHG